MVCAAATQGDRRADVVVVGAGILGLSAACALLRRFPRLHLLVLEKEGAIGLHQTGRSSGVIHSGIYYAPGSLKARLCVEGAARLYAHCDEHGIPYRRCGKVVVATGPEEVPRLEELYRRGIANGVQGLELIGRERLAELEPHVTGVRALHVPGTGIVEYGAVAASYAGEVAEHGGEVLLGYGVRGLVRRGGSVVLETDMGSVEARHVVTCGGVHADRLAAMSGGAREPRIIPFRGDYYVLEPRSRRLLNGLVYPVPDPSFPFLGIHSTLRLDGSMWLGPNAVLALAREGYSRRQLDLRDLRDVLGSRGFRRLAARYWRVGLEETVRDYSKRLFVASARKLVPELRSEDVRPGPAGIRAQALAPDGTLLDDFVFERAGSVVNVRNAPSPGATSSLPIGEMIADMAAGAFGLRS